MILRRGEIKIEFNYEESCSNVYKTFRVYKNNKKSTRRALGELSDRLPEICTANTYFWRPSSTAAARRAKERYYEDLVMRFFMDEGFTIEEE